MRPLLILAGVVIGFCVAGVIYVPMIHRAHETANMAAEAAEQWRKVFCGTLEGRASGVCQQDEPRIVKPTTERIYRNPRVLI